MLSLHVRHIDTLRELELCQLCCLKKLVAAITLFSIDWRNIQKSVRAIRLSPVFYTRNAHNERILETRIYLNKCKPHLLASQSNVDDFDQTCWPRCIGDSRLPFISSPPLPSIFLLLIYL